MKFGLKEEIIHKINNIFLQYSAVEEAILYGSRAKGNFKKGSDIDIVLKGAKLNLSELHNIMIEIDDLSLPYSVDISLLHTINNPDLLDHIRRRGVVFYTAENVE